MASLPGSPGSDRGVASLPGSPGSDRGVASLPGSSAQCTTSRNTAVPQCDPCTGCRVPCSPARFQADPVWYSPADSPSVSWEMRYKCALWGGPPESRPNWMSILGSPHWKNCRHRGTLSVWRCTRLGEWWSKGNHSSHPPSVALLSFVVQRVLHPPCWDLEFSHSFFFLLHHTACGILVPPPGMEPKFPAVKGLSPNHWTTREVPTQVFLPG